MGVNGTTHARLDIAASARAPQSRGSARGSGGRERDQGLHGLEGKRISITSNRRWPTAAPGVIFRTTAPPRCSRQRGAVQKQVVHG